MLNINTTPVLQEMTRNMSISFNQTNTKINERYGSVSYGRVYTGTMLHRIRGMICMMVLGGVGGGVKNTL